MMAPHVFQRHPVRRRGLLLGVGGLVAAFGAGCAGIPVIPKRPAPDLDAARGWVVWAEGRYTLLAPRVEMGQNILTALKHIACTELGVQWSELDVRLPDSRSIARAKATVGSDSIREYALPLAQACAALREARAQGMGARRLREIAVPDVPMSQLRAFKSQSPVRAPHIVQGLEIVSGGALYAADVRLDGMVYGRVLRSGASGELVSRVASMNEADARRVPGFVALVRDKWLSAGKAEGLGIVARTPGALDRIEAALAVRWFIGPPEFPVAVELPSEGAPANTVVREGEVKALAGALVVDVSLYVPPAAHAPIEPRACVAQPELDADRVVGMKLWVGSQDPFYCGDVVAKRLDLDTARVTVQPMRVGGAFGGKTICTVELEAALLARAVRAPLKIQWSRAQEFRYGFVRPPSAHRIRAQVKEGRIQRWQHRFASSHILFTSAVLPSWMQRITDFIGDDGVARGAKPPYRFASVDVGFDLQRLGVWTGPWRGLGAGPNVWAIETAIDACARAAGADPVAFRLAHLDVARTDDLRLARCLRAVAAASRWGQTPDQSAIKSGERIARGVACGIYKAMSYAAVVADIAINERGAVRVLRMWCAHDCGRVVDADQVRAQCEGNLVWGLGMALIESLPIASTGVAANTFADSPVPRVTDVPAMAVVLIDEGEPPSGAGETAIVASAAAVTNAIAAATGRTVTHLPYTGQSQGT